MIFNLFRKPESPRLTAIYIAEKGGAMMQACQTATAIEQQGLTGDRYCTGQGYWHRVESCQVTLISEYDLKQAQKRQTVTLNNGEHRRNLVISGIRTQQLKHCQLHIGDAVFAYHKPRPACGYINKITQQKMMEALKVNCGICLKVIKGGRFNVGDHITITYPSST